MRYLSLLLTVNLFYLTINWCERRKCSVFLFLFSFFLLRIFDFWIQLNFITLSWMDQTIKTRHIFSPRAVLWSRLWSLQCQHQRFHDGFKGWSGGGRKCHGGNLFHWRNWDGTKLQPGGVSNTPTSRGDGEGIWQRTGEERTRNSELYYTRIKILGSCLFLQSLHANRLRMKQ